MSRVLSNFFYDIKYAVGGVERGVDACFVEKTKLVRGSHEATCCGMPNCRRTIGGAYRCACAS